MRGHELLSSTSIVSSSGLDLVFVSEQASRIATDGNPKRAIELLCSAFFYSELRDKSMRSKQSVLRNVWRAVERHYEDRFVVSMRAELEFIGDANDLDWCDDVPGVTDSAIDVVLPQILAERAIALTLGKCAALVQMMCAKGGRIEERYLGGIAEMLIQT